MFFCPYPHIFEPKLNLILFWGWDFFAHHYIGTNIKDVFSKFLFDFFLPAKA